MLNLIDRIEVSIKGRISMFYVYLTNPVYCVSFFETGQRVTLYQLPTKMSSEQVIKNIEFKTENI